LFFLAKYTVFWAVAFFIEGMFSLWAGFRCYDYASHRSQGSWEVVSQLPLCKGRSRISEALCPQWVEITNSEIPDQFWKALEEDKLRDKQTWKAIYSFSKNCERRWAAEKLLRKDLLLTDSEPVVLPDRVPGSSLAHE
jgi:hypothetical protein